MDLNEITGRIVDAAFRIHRDVGPGLLESVYEVVLSDLLQQDGLDVERQKPILIRFGGKTFEEGYRADLVEAGLVLVEIKSVEQLTRVHRKQVLTYLKLSELRVGLLSNFGGATLKGNIERLVHGELPDLHLDERSKSRGRIHFNPP